jgi:hypothetical protein
MAETQTMLKEEYSIKQHVIMTRNPQANSMVERAHQTFHQMIRINDFVNSEINLEDPFSGILSACAFAMRSTVHSANSAMPAQLVFGQDAIQNTVFKANWWCISDRKCHCIQQINCLEALIG